MATSPRAAHEGAPAPPLGPPRPVVWPPRTLRRLDNGLQVVLVEAHTIPKITAQLFARSGDAAGGREGAGVAELTAAVVRAGTSARDRQRIEEDLRRMGADLATSSGADSSVISISGLAEFSRQIMGLAAEVARDATFPAAEFERERTKRLEELKIERATPGFLAGERLRHVLFGEHPYAVVAPTPAQIEAARREHLEDFYRRHYTPENAVLIVVGDFAAAQMLDEIGDAFGNWRGSAPPPASEPALPALSGRCVFLVDLPGTDQAQVLVGNRAITRRDPDWLALTLANSILGGAFNSRLVANIREQKGYSYSPRSAAHALRRHGYFSVHAAVRNAVTAATLTEIFYELDRMRALPVGDEELADARNYLGGVFSLGLATQDGLAGQLTTLFLNELPADYLETYREKIAALSAQVVLSAARRWFDSVNAQIVVVGDRAEIYEQAAQFGEVEVWDREGNWK